MLAGFSKKMKRDFLINWIICGNDTTVSWRKLKQWSLFIGETYLLSLFCFVVHRNWTDRKRCAISGMLWLKFVATFKGEMKESKVKVQSSKSGFFLFICLLKCRLHALSVFSARKNISPVINEPANRTHFLKLLEKEKAS